MRKPSAFRPLVMDRLEDRLVPSHLVKPAPAAVVRPHTPPSAETLATDRVRSAYSAFVTNFTEAVNVDLYAPSVSGYGSNAPLFSQQLGQELAVLERSVLKSVGRQPAGTTLPGQIHQAITGAGAGSLRNRLGTLTNSSLGLGSAISAYETTALGMIQQNFHRDDKAVVAAMPPSTAASSASGS